MTYISRDSDAQSGVLAPSSRGWTFSPYTGVANEGSIVRFVPWRDMSITTLAFLVTVAASIDDPCDVALYSSAMSRIVSAGTTSGKLNSTGIKTFTIGTTVLTAGTVYYAGFAYGTLGGTAASILGAGWASASATLYFGGTNGVLEQATMASAFPLPATFTPATPVNTRPVIAVREV